MSDYVIQTKDLTKQYRKQLAADKVNIHIRKGTIYGLLGRNGAGKSTIMKMLLGLTPISSGEAEVFGQNVRQSGRKIYPRIGAIVETPGFYPNLTATENLEIFAKLRGTSRLDAVKRALDVVGLPYKDKKLFDSFSIGMKQRLGIARAIMHDPELLILDEPINGLDPIGISEIRGFLQQLSREQGKTILISSHILSEIDLMADDVGIIHNGRLLEENSMKELKRKNQKYILFRVSSTASAARILERQFAGAGYRVEDDTVIRIYDTEINLGAVNKAFITNGIDVFESRTCDESLEDYFKEITGGVGIA